MNPDWRLGELTAFERQESGILTWKLSALLLMEFENITNVVFTEFL